MHWSELNIDVHKAGIDIPPFGGIYRHYYPPGYSFMEIAREMAISHFYEAHCQDNSYGSWKCAGDWFSYGCQSIGGLEEIEYWGEDYTPTLEQAQDFYDDWNDQGVGYCLPVTAQLHPNSLSLDFAPVGSVTGEEPVLMTVTEKQGGVIQTYTEDVRGWNYKELTLVCFTLWYPYKGWNLKARRVIPFVPLALLALGAALFSTGGSIASQAGMMQADRRKRRLRS